MLKFKDMAIEPSPAGKLTVTAIELGAEFGKVSYAKGTTGDAVVQAAILTITDPQKRVARLVVSNGFRITLTLEDGPVVAEWAKPRDGGYTFTAKHKAFDKATSETLLSLAYEAAQEAGEAYRAWLADPQTFIEAKGNRSNAALHAMLGLRSGIEADQRVQLRATASGSAPLTYTEIQTAREAAKAERLAGGNSDEPSDYAETMFG